MKTVRGTEVSRNETGELSAKQSLAAVALASGATFEDAALASGAGCSTVKDWSANSVAFRERVRTLTAEFAADLSARLLGRMTLGMVTAIDTLERLCRTAKAESTQVKAAEVLLTKGIELGEVRDLKARLEALEGQR